MFNRQNFVKTKISLKIQLENKIFPIDGLCCCCCLFVNGEPLRRLFVDWALHSAEVRWRCTTVTMFFDDARQCRCSLTTHDSADVLWRCTTVPMFADDARQCRCSLTTQDSADVRWRCTTAPFVRERSTTASVVCERSTIASVVRELEHHCSGGHSRLLPQLSRAFHYYYSIHILSALFLQLLIIVRFKLFTSLRIADDQIFRMHNNKL